MRAVTSVIDKLGLLQAQIAELCVQEEVLKDELCKRGPGAYEGELFRATVSSKDTRTTFDAAAAKEKLLALGYHAFVKKHTHVAPCKRTVKINAKTGAFVGVAS